MDSSHPPQEPSYTDHKEAAQQVLREECEQLWAQLQQKHESLREKTTPSGTAGHEPLAEVYAVKEKLLQAQIQAYKDFKPQPLSTDPVIQEELLDEELTSALSQLQDTLVFVRTQHTELQETAEREDGWLQKDKQVKLMLEDRLQELTQEAQQPLNNTSVLKEIEEKTVKAAGYEKKLMKQMNQFIQEHFPPPTEEDVKKFAKTSKKRPLSAADVKAQRNQILSLQNLLEELVNKSVENPQDPYIVIGPAHWPPYIELLMRYGVAQKHREDDAKLRITPVHL